jgi:signal transduction histidine kinase
LSERPTSRFAGITRSTWWLWGTTFTVLIALTVTVTLLNLQTADGSTPTIWKLDARVAGSGLASLVLLFCLYVGLRQRELERTREALRREEAELADARTRLSEVSELFGVSTALNLQLRLEVILEIIVRRVVSTLQAQQASVMIVNPETGVLETRASYGLDSEFARNARQRLGEGIAGWVAERQQAVLLGPDESDPTFRQHYKHDRQISSALSLPLRVGDRCVGVLNVNRIFHPQPFREHHRDMLRMFAEHVGSVIERAEVMERLTTRTQVLERSNLQLSELNRMKDVFLSTATHELKTPLTSVIAYAELLEDPEHRLTPAQQAEFLRRLHAEATTLLGLIDDILDLSRLETGKLVMQRESASVNDVVRAGIETTQALADKHGIVLEEEFDADLPALSLDIIKMRQVVVNLLANAIKFSPAGSRVTACTRSEDGFVIIEVMDQGPGVAPEDAVQIFELFGQGTRAREQRTGGLGIGLHLVRRISELHGGHVGVQAGPNGGSRFWVRLPATPAVAKVA